MPATMAAAARAGSTTKLPWIRTPRRPVMCIAAMPRPRIRLAAITRVLSRERRRRAKAASALAMLARSHASVIAGS